jgi:plasmid stabilization system protein ParE
MAKIIWSEEAIRVYLEHVEYARMEFGRSTAKRWQTERKQIEWRLELYPTSYPPEPLLRNMAKIYRSCHIMRKRFKIIYSYDEVNDMVHVLDIWDTRMNPETLTSRIM